MNLLLLIAPVKTNTLAQLSSELQHLLDRLADALPPAFQKRYKQLIYRVTAIKSWLWSGAALLLLWVWVWQWVLSIAVGLIVMIGVYLAQQRQLKVSWRGWSKLWNRSNRASTLAVLSGVLALGSTYLATAVWLESDQHWLATSVLLEGFGLLVILSLLLWQLLNRQFQQQDQQIDNQLQVLLNNLSETDPLKRLIAARQLTQLVLAHDPVNSAFPMTPVHLAECFRLMLDRETEPLVCSALIDGLRALQPSRQLAGTQLPTVSTPSIAKTATKIKVKRHLSTEDQPG